MHLGFGNPIKSILLRTKIKYSMQPMNITALSF